MKKFKLVPWVTQEFSKTWTHILGGFLNKRFIAPQFDDRTLIGHVFFFYDRNANIGANFVTIKDGHLTDGSPVQDGLYKVGRDYTFGTRWTHITYPSIPGQQGTILFYDADSGVSEFYVASFTTGDLIFRRRYTDWRTSWSKVLGGRYANSNLILYDALDGTFEFYWVDASCDLHLRRSTKVRHHSLHTITGGTFSNNRKGSLIFYAKDAGIGEFYNIFSNGGLAIFSKHENWRTTWQKVLPGRLLPDYPVCDGLLFYEENTGYTEFYSTDCQGNISQIDINLPSEWDLPWQFIAEGFFIPSNDQLEPGLGIKGTSNLLCYNARDGMITYFYIEGAIQTLIDLNGKWTQERFHHMAISEKFTEITINMSSYNRPSAYGSVIDDSTITVTFPDDATYIGKLQLPNMIKWSNGSVWTKI